MYICKKCGNYYQFEGTSVTYVANKLDSTRFVTSPKDNKYEEETTLSYEDVSFLCCKNCGSNSVVSVNINDLPQRLQDQIYNTINMGVIDTDIAVELKDFVK